MAQTFDIRFARSAGLAAMLEAPSNSFQWTGNGSLSIDAQGISIAVKRGLLSLLGRNRTRRIPAADLWQVFREGEALRVEFATNDTTRASLRFWANDRDTAARIVHLLPTSRTVELEESAAVGGFRLNRRIAAVLGLALAVIAAVIAAISFDHPRLTTSAGAASREVAAFEPEPIQQPLLTTDAAATPLVDEPAVRAPLPVIRPEVYAPDGTAGTGGTTSDTATRDITSTLDGIPSPAGTGLADPEPQLSLTASQLSLDVPPIVQAPRVPAEPAVTDPSVTPIPHGTSSFNRALRQLAIFGAESDDLLAEYDDDLNRFRAGQIGELAFLMRLAVLEKRWLGVTYRIQDAEDFADPLLVDLRATLLACARERRYFLTSFSKGTSTRDQQSLKSALEHQALANELNQKARRFID